MSVPENHRVGFFGKVPALGDFVSRRLPRQFIDPWDQWLQGSLRASQEMLGDQWLSLFLVSPIWRFTLSPGLCGPSAWAGVMMPSVDRVGRYYPLTLAQAVDANAVSAMFLPESDWFSRLEEAALAGLAEQFDLDGFDREILAIDAASAGQFALDSTGERVGSAKQAVRFDLDSLAQVGNVFPRLSQLLLDRYLGNYSLWACHGTQQGRPNFLYCEGLPPLDAYAGFLQGAPRHSNAWQCQVFSLATPPVSEAVGAVNSESPPLPPLPELSGVVPSLAWNSHGITVVGNKRKHNEDAMLCRPGQGLWVVADGMGGHQSGDLASRLLVDSLAEMPELADLDAEIAWVGSRLIKVNDDLCRFALSLQQGAVIGTTVVVLLARGRQCAAVWAGDSRLYRFRAGRIEQVTRDHTLLDELMETGLMSREDALQQVGANVITRAVGGQAKLELDTLRFVAEAGDRYLLCSDGLDKELADDEIADMLAGASCQTVAEALINAALNRTGRDNITVVVAEWA
ncbi:type VI secretion system-associated protein TagF [Methylomonas sp. UP202]|uniref:type VI secretion system-associated protein TagF n=1 Tax=Methylomonas sp. UP202 TaxID=3040943 RepID=UPI00247920D5|nr:type VI secretion system-associated protein TagF [Methylomonas sp. UP202]WGS86509.1 type VI secretion system-associated protein TagF [Methylomonas sp. UP202]